MKIFEESYASTTHSKRNRKKVTTRTKKKEELTNETGRNLRTGTVHISNNYIRNYVMKYESDQILYLKMYSLS